MKRALLLVVLLAGCAARSEKAAPSAPMKAADQDGVGEGPPPPSTGVDATKAPSTAPVPGTGGSSTMVVSPEVSSAQTKFEDAAKAVSTAGSDCAQLCKALHSMTHATERLCELTQTGPATDQQRCVDARSRLEAAKAKVNSTCGTC